MDQAVKTFNDFKAAFSSNDLKKASSLLSTLKIKLTEFTALPPVFEQTGTAQQELVLAREVLEHAVLLSVKLKDEAAFERNFLQNRIAEFHTELELIAPEVHKNVYVNYAIELEQCLMEGSYNKVMSARQDVPAESYSYFMDLLMETIRDEIAGCAEKAYRHLELADAKKMMLFKGDAEIQQYASERGWEVSGGTVTFQPTEAKACGVPSLELISSSLSYAKELERIV